MTTEETQQNGKDASLSETQIAIMLRHAPDLAFERQVESARGIVASEWENATDERSEKITRIRSTEHYNISQLGWRIHDDFGVSDPKVRMVVVTPVPAWENLQDLEEITRKFVHEMKNQAMGHIRAMQKASDLSPAEFTALMVEVVGDGEIQEYESALGHSDDEFRADLNAATNAISQSQTLTELAGLAAVSTHVYDSKSEETGQSSTVDISRDDAEGGEK